MKKLIFALILAVMLIAVPAELFAVFSGDPVQQFPLPFLLTSGGQGAGSKSLRMLVQLTKKYTAAEAGGDFWLEDETPERYAYIDSGNFKTLVIVISVTEKGLGASGITIDDEIERLKRMVAHCKEINLPIVALLMEQDKRSKIPTNANERCIDLICPNAEWMICIKGGNSDGRFDALKAQYNIPLTVYSKAPMDLMNIFKQMLPK